MTSRSQNAFTLPELLISVLILVPLMTGTFPAFIRSVDLNELSNHTSIAMAGLSDRLEEIKGETYGQVAATYDNQTFTLNNLPGAGLTTVDDSNPQLLTVRLVYCWAERNGRVIGEDTNLNGVLNAGEDANGNGQLDSPAVLTAMISEL